MPGQPARWASQQRLIMAKDPLLDWNDAREISGYGPGTAANGYLYRVEPATSVQTEQIVIFELATGAMDVAFHPVGRSIAAGEAPVYTAVVKGTSSDSGSTGCLLKPGAGVAWEALLLLVAPGPAVVAVRLRRSR